MPRLSRIIRSPLKLLDVRHDKVSGPGPTPASLDCSAEVSHPDSELQQRATAPPEDTRVPPDYLTTLLPELWDKVFRHLDAEGFMATAAVCRLFDRLSSTAYLVERGVSRESIVTGNVVLASNIILALRTVLGTSLCLPPTITRLSCRFGPNDDGFGEQLCCLRSVVLQCPSLQELDLRFPENAFCLRRWSGLSGPPSEWRMIPTGLTEAEVDRRCNSFHDLMAVMAQGLVVCVDPKHAFSCRPPDLCRSQFDPGYCPQGNWISRTREAVGIAGSTHSRPSRQRMPTVYSTNLVCPYGWSYVQSVTVRRIQPFDARPSFTLVITNEGMIRDLHLGRQKSEPKIPRLSASQLNDVLPHLTLPDLYTVELHTGDIDPEIFSQFLMRHAKNLGILKYSDVDIDHLRSPRVLATPPAQLPELKNLSSDSAAGLIRVIDAVHPIEEQRLHLSFPISRASKTQLTNHRLLLRKIAARTTKKTTLVITLRSSDTYQPHEEEAEIVRSLLCVSSVMVSIQGEAVCTKGILPWLAPLPALEQVELVHWLRRPESLVGQEPYPSSDEIWDELLDEAVTALPRLQTLEKNSYRDSTHVTHILRRPNPVTRDTAN
ncbi:hypothetical protein DFH06DRAFT_1465578 [Mycena polygramma]|nr:hypothetical protein DFH06DRAFT_1465578 [Mycena polygramma]